MSQVVHYGGVSPILLLHNHQQPGALDDTTATALFASAGEADGSALVDALECLLAASAAPSFDAPAAAGDALVQGGAMEALAACLQRLADALTATPPPSVGGAGYQQQHNAALLAMALLERLLTGAAPAGRRADVLGQRPGAVATVATALAALVGSPRLLRPCPGRDAPAEGATSSAASGSGAQAASSSSAAAAAGAGGGAGGGAAAAAGAGGAAQLQLESLHVLLVLLRECQAPGAESALYGLQLQGLGTEAQPGIRGLAGAEPWAVAVRRGLGWLLRSRAPVALRHMALQLAAVTVQLVGEGWLLGAGAEWQGQARAQGKGRGQGKEAAGERPGEFLVLLLEVLRVSRRWELDAAVHVPGSTQSCYIDRRVRVSVAGRWCCLCTLPSRMSVAQPLSLGSVRVLRAPPSCTPLLPPSSLVRMPWPPPLRFQLADRDGPAAARRTAPHTCRAAGGGAEGGGGAARGAAAQPAAAA